MNVKLLKIASVLSAVCVVAIASIAVFNGRPSVRQMVEAKGDGQEAKPLFVLIEYNHWAMVVGADTPNFALYDDGTVIFWREEDRGGKYVSTKLADSEVSQILEKVSPQTFASLERRYDPARGFSHAPETLMVLQTKDGSYKEVYVFGSIRHEEDGSYPRGIPNLLADIFQFINTYDNAKATEWAPNDIEVMVWPYEYAPDEDVLWPKGWPDLSDSRTVKKDDLYTIYLEKARLEELKTFLGKIRERQAVRISGKKWTVDARLPFPQERIWRDIKNKLERGSQ